MRSYSITIVTPGYISSTPRVVKEADALHEAGYKVNVIFSQGNLEQLRQFDEELLSKKKWGFKIVKWSNSRRSESYRYYKCRIRQNFYKMLPSFIINKFKIAENAEGRVYKELSNLACSVESDLYIGHYPVGLAAAADAAQIYKEYLGYDIEDLHTEEDSCVEDIRKKKRIEIIERKYIRNCIHLTAVSDLISSEITKKYNTTNPITIKNVFPYSERSQLDDIRKDRINQTLSIYWYSQVIGPGRGLEDLFHSLKFVKNKIQIHLRGSISNNYKNKLLNIAALYKMGKNIYFHPQVSPCELLSRSSEHDIGLALEQPVSKNRMLTVTNKLFFYFLSGLAVIATETPGQSEIMNQCKEVGFLYKPGDHYSLANYINKLIANKELLKKYKDNSLSIAQNVFNWENEKIKFLQSVEIGLNSH